MPSKTIRPIAICVFQDNGRILVAESFDSEKNQIFYRPLGGTIEFGEHSRDTIRREMREEMKVEVTDLRSLGTLENIFIYEGQPGHEIVLVYEGRLVDPILYAQETLEGYEMDIDEPFKVVWKQLRELGPGKSPVHPDGLLELLESMRT